MPPSCLLSNFWPICKIRVIINKVNTFHFCMVLGKAKNKFRSQLPLIVAFIIEASLMIVVVILLMVGLIGIFLPLIPGIVMFGLAVTIYLFLVNKRKSKVALFFHRYVLLFSNIFKNKKSFIKFMSFLKRIKEKKQKKMTGEILKYGIILFGFNVSLVLALFFTFSVLSFIINFFSTSWFALAFAPLIVIFIFSAACAIIWYRFGQILARRFTKSSLLYAGLVSVVSVVLLLLLLVLLLIIIFGLGLSNSLLNLIFAGTFLITILAVIFEWVIISLGIITK